jgi:CheY-like chemotaxis protein
MPARILAVDDEVDELTAWETLLRRAGYFVRTAPTGARALALCDEWIFDVVILDYVMPKMKGLELLARIRQKNPLVRSIIVSGKLDLGTQEVRDSIRTDVETDRHLHKPVKNEELLETIADLLKDKPANRPWDTVSADYVKSGKGTVAGARKAQAKLKKHLRKGKA